MTTLLQSRRGDLCYGARDLKVYICQATTKGLSLTLLSLLGIGIMYCIIKFNSSTISNISAVIGRIKTINLLPPPITQAISPLSQIPVGPATRSGMPIPVPDIIFQGDYKDFASIDEVSRANPTGGDGEDQGFLGLVRDIETEVREEEKPPYVFDPVDKEPYIDLKEIQKRVVYPEPALRAGISGKVILRVLVGKNGIPKKYLFEYSDSQLFNESAVQAVMGSIFTPAIYHNQPTECWVSIPIIFRLR